MPMLVRVERAESLVESSTPARVGPGSYMHEIPIKTHKTRPNFTPFLSNSKQRVSNNSEECDRPQHRYGKLRPLVPHPEPKFGPEPIPAISKRHSEQPLVTRKDRPILNVKRRDSRRQSAILALEDSRNAVFQRRMVMEASRSLPPTTTIPVPTRPRETYSALVTTLVNRTAPSIPSFARSAYKPSEDSDAIASSHDTVLLQTKRQENQDAEVDVSIGALARSKSVPNTSISSLNTQPTRSVSGVLDFGKPSGKRDGFMTTIDSTPGPGEYGARRLERKVGGRLGSSSFASRTRKLCNIAQVQDKPGPGTYDLTGPKSTAAKDTETIEGIGVGDGATEKVARRRRKKPGFGSGEERKRDFLLPVAGRQKIPGPGSYSYSHSKPRKNTNFSAWMTKVNLGDENTRLRRLKNRRKELRAASKATRSKMTKTRSGSRSQSDLLRKKKTRKRNKIFKSRLQLRPPSRRLTLLYNYPELPNEKRTRSTVIDDAIKGASETPGPADCSATLDKYVLAKFKKNNLKLNQVSRTIRESSKNSHMFTSATKRMPNPEVAPKIELLSTQSRKPNIWRQKCPDMRVKIDPLHRQRLRHHKRASHSASTSTFLTSINSDPRLHTTSFVSRSRKTVPIKYIGPGPGDYNIRSDLAPKIRNESAGLFSSKSMTFLSNESRFKSPVSLHRSALTRTSSRVGPGAYNVTAPLMSKRTFNVSMDGAHHSTKRALSKEFRWKPSNRKIGK